MKTQKLSLASYAVSVLLATAFAAMPPYQAMAADGVQTKVMRYEVNVPQPGQAVVLPDGIPVEVRAQVTQAILDVQAGGPSVITVVAPDSASQAQSPEAMKEALKQAEKVFREMGLDTGTTTVSPRMAAYCVVIIVVIVIIILGYVFYKIVRFCKQLQKAIDNRNTNIDNSISMVPNPYGSTSAASAAVSPRDATTVYSTNLFPISFDGTAGGNTNLLPGDNLVLNMMYTTNGPDTTNWSTAYTIAIGDVYYNDDGSAFCRLDITNGTTHHWFWLNGYTTNCVFSNTNLGAIPLSVPMPNAPQMFFRMTQ